MKPMIALIATGIVLLLVVEKVKLASFILLLYWRLALREVMVKIQDMPLVYFSCLLFSL